MRRLVASLIVAMPLDPFARRALAETLADWKHQDSTASSAARRVCEALRGLAAVAGAMARLTMREVGSADAWRATGKILGVGVFVSSLILLEPILGMLRDKRVGADLWLVGYLALLLLPQALLIGVALAALTLPTLRAGTVPAWGTGALLLVATITSLQWVVPNTNQEFRSTALRATTGGGGRLERGLPESTLAEIAALTFSAEPQGRDARRMLGARATVAVLAPALLWLGMNSGRLMRAYGQRRGGALLAWGTCGTCAVVGRAVGVGAEWFGDPIAHALPLALLAALFYGALAARREQVAAFRVKA